MPKYSVWFKIRLEVTKPIEAASLPEAFEKAKTVKFQDLVKLLPTVEGNDWNVKVYGGFDEADE